MKSPNSELHYLAYLTCQLGLLRCGGGIRSYNVVTKFADMKDVVVAVAAVATVRQHGRKVSR